LQPELAGPQWLALAPPELLPAAAKLVAHRRAHGLTAAAQDLTAVYAAFGDGLPVPEAIRAYLAALRPPPPYVVLFGDGSADPRGYLARPGHPATPNLLPPYLAVVDPWAGETASDHRYSLLRGADLIPDTLIGRLPAADLAQAEAMVAKIIRYETVPAVGPAARQTLIASDDADRSGSYPADAAAIAAALPPQFAQTSARLGIDGDRDALAAVIASAWRAGTALQVYVGHASVHQWALENLFHRDQIAALPPTHHPPIVFEASCFTGAFHSPAYTVLDETLLARAAGGAVAGWGPSGLGLGRGHIDLGQGFLRALTAGATLGEATRQGKLDLLAHNPAYADLVETFTLFGDPALRLAVPVDLPQRAVLPLLAR
jgi:hypothetical protein